MFQSFVTSAALIAAAVSLLTAGASAQPLEVHFGGQVGLAQARLTDMSGSMYTFNVDIFGGHDVTVTGGNSQYNSGVSFGGWGYYALDPRFGVQLGIFFTQQGGRLTQSGSQTVPDPVIPGISARVQYQFEHNVEIRYVRFPWLAKARFPTRHVTPFVKLGPDIGILTSARRETTGFYAEPPGSASVPIREFEDDEGRFRRVDVALHLAAGVDVPVRPGAAYAEVAYSFGLGDVNKSTAGIFPSGVKNSVLFVSVGFSY